MTRPKPGSADGDRPPDELDGLIQLADFRAALRSFLRHSEEVARRHGLTPQRSVAETASHRRQLERSFEALVTSFHA